MEEEFTITLVHKGVEKAYSGRLRISAYTHQFLFQVEGVEIILERDDEGRFRAILPQASREGQKEPDPSLVRELVRTMDEEMKD